MSGDWGSDTQCSKSLFVRGHVLGGGNYSTLARKGGSWYVQYNKGGLTR